MRRSAAANARIRSEDQATDQVRILQGHGDERWLKRDPRPAPRKAEPLASLHQEIAQAENQFRSGSERGKHAGV